MNNNSDKKNSAYINYINPSITHISSNNMVYTSDGDVNNMSIQNFKLAKNTDNEWNDKEEPVKTRGAAHKKGSDDKTNTNSDPNIQMPNITENLSDEKQIKFFESIKSMFNNMNMNTNANLKNEELFKAKMIEELSEKLDFLEREKISINKQFKAKEKSYLDKIKSLDNQTEISQKFDLEFLQKQNKELENQITHLKQIIKSMEDKHNEDKKKFNNLVAEVMLLKEKLILEINDMEQIKREVMTHSIDAHDDNEIKGKNHVEFVFRENDSVVMDMKIDKLPDKILPVNNTEIASVSPEYINDGKFSNSISVPKLKVHSSLNRKATSQRDLQQDELSNIKRDVGKSPDKKSYSQPELLNNKNVKIRNYNNFDII
jgi:hypothetical protein